jgi:hypothetical protein
VRANQINLQGVHWVHKCMWCRWAFQYHKETINLIHERHYPPTSKFVIREILWKIPQKKCANKQDKRSENSIRKTLQFIRTWIKRVSFTSYSPASLRFEFIFDLSNYKIQSIRRRLNPIKRICNQYIFDRYSLVRLLFHN